MSVQRALDAIVAAELGRGHCSEVALGVLDGDQFTHASAGGWNGRPMDVDTPFLIASTSKLFVTAMVFQLVAEGRAALDDPVVRFFQGELAGLHTWRGEDHTERITLRHLLTHTSGLPDYFEGKRRDGTVFASELFAGRDRAYGLAEVLQWVRDDMRPAFTPGAGRKALYSDTNFYLLTEVVARVTSQSIDDALASRVTEPLGLTRTAFYQPGMDALPLRFGAKVVDMPLALTSMPGDGGAVSTLADLAAFTRAFFEGALFPRPMLDTLPPWRRVFFPIQAGTGVLRFAMPRWMPPFRADLAFIGHSGITGTVAFSCPARGRIVVGTINQLQGRERPYRMMVKAALA